MPDEVKSREQALMDTEGYINERLDKQIKWYDRKSVSSQSWYKRLRIVEIVLAASIPFLVGYVSDGSPWVRLAVGAAGVVIAIISGVVVLHRFQENWTEYRTTCESLRHHKYRFQTRTDPYTGEDAFHDLVDNVEALISKENTNWAEYIKAEAKENKHG